MIARRRLERARIARAVLARCPGRLLFGLCLLAACCFPAAAQVQRSIVNPSFEAPNLVSNGCRVYIDHARVPGWITTHTPFNEGTGGESCAAAIAGFPGWPRANVPIIELWRTPRDNASGGIVNAPQGSQIAELNAEVASRLYQNVCLINGESFRWRFSHRGRGGIDRANFVVGAATNIVSVTTNNNGTWQAPVPGAGTTGVAVTPVAGNATWIGYSGTYLYGGASGNTSLGFEAVGGTTSGNLLDDIRIELAPFVEFIAPGSSTPESASDNRPTLRVNGTVYVAFTVTVEIVGGTATIGEDFTTPGNSTTLTVNVPAGNYDGTSAGSLFPLPITVINDTAGEGNETILLEIQPPPGPTPPYLLRSSTTCGGPAQTTWTYTIVDDDARISITKNAAAPVPVSGQPGQFDIAYTIVVNNPSGLSANYSLVDTPGMDPDVSIVSASYSRTGPGSGGGPASGTLAGSGPWTLAEQWRTLAAGNTNTFTVNVRIQVNRGGSIGNDACTVPSTAGSGLHNSATATVEATSGGFVGSACQNTPTPVWVQLRKRLDGRVVATDQAQIRLLSGGIPVATATTTGSAVPATATTGVRVLPAGATMQFDEAIKANGTGPDQLPSNYQTALACTNATAGSTTVLPTGPGTPVGARQQWAEFSPAGGDDLDCLITNTPFTADLWVRKTNTPALGPDDQADDTVLSGTQTTYDILVGNSGPGMVSNAVLRDPPPIGLSNCQLGAPACAVTSGTATCPATGSGAGQLSIANLQGAGGVLIPLMQADSTIRIRVTCTVN